MMSPHYDNRPEFDNIAINEPLAYAVENKSAIVFVNGSYSYTLTAGGNSYKFENGVKVKL